MHFCEQPFYRYYTYSKHYIFLQWNGCLCSFVHFSIELPVCLLSSLYTLELYRFHVLWAPFPICGWPLKLHYRIFKKLILMISNFTNLSFYSSSLLGPQTSWKSLHILPDVCVWYKNRCMILHRCPWQLTHLDI